MIGKLPNTTPPSTFQLVHRIGLRRSGKAAWGGSSRSIRFVRGAHLDLAPTAVTSIHKCASKMVVPGLLDFLVIDVRAQYVTPHCTCSPIVLRWESHSQLAKSLGRIAADQRACHVVGGVEILRTPRLPKWCELHRCSTGWTRWRS